MKKKIFSVFFALVLVLSLSLVTAAPVAAQPTGVFTVASGTYTTVYVNNQNGDIGATLTGAWSGGSVIGDFTATGVGGLYLANPPAGGPPPWYGTTAAVSVSGTMSTTVITFSGTAVRTVGDPITTDSIDGITGTVTISNGDFVADLSGEIVGSSTVVNIDITGSMVLATSTVGVTANTLPSIVAISVTPDDIDFGTLYPGQSSGPTPITVDNVGTVIVNVDALLDPATGTVFDNLELGGTSPPSVWAGMTGLAVNGSDTVPAQLVVPSNYSALGPETATLIFEATAQ